MSDQGTERPLSERVWEARFVIPDAAERLAISNAIAALEARIAELEKENERLTQALTNFEGQTQDGNRSPALHEQAYRRMWKEMDVKDARIAALEARLVQLEQVVEALRLYNQGHGYHFLARALRAL